MEEKIYTELPQLIHSILLDINCSYNGDEGIVKVNANIIKRIVDVEIDRTIKMIKEMNLISKEEIECLF